MRITEIAALPTTIETRDPKYVGCLGVHESVLRAYQIVVKVKELLAAGTPAPVVLELVEDMESAKPKPPRDAAAFVSLEVEFARQVFEILFHKNLNACASVAETQVALDRLRRYVEFDEARVAEGPNFVPPETLAFAGDVVKVLFGEDVPVTSSEAEATLARLRRFVELEREKKQGGALVPTEFAEELVDHFRIPRNEKERRELAERIAKRKRDARNERRRRAYAKAKRRERRLAKGKKGVRRGR